MTKKQQSKLKDLNLKKITIRIIMYLSGQKREIKGKKEKMVISEMIL